MQELSERDICSKFITPALTRAGWNLQTQIFEEQTLTAGRVIVRGKMVAPGKNKRADYVLFAKPNIPIAVVEAKDANHAVGDGIQQALEYADMLRVPFAFSSNGTGFVFHDRTGQSPELEATLSLDEFPSPDALLAKYKAWRGLDEDASKVALHAYYDSGKTPRYGEGRATAENGRGGADGLEMLPHDLSGRAFNQSKHNRALRYPPRRSRGSIDFRQATLSTALNGLPPIGRSGTRGGRRPRAVISCDRRARPTVLGRD